MLRLLRYLIHTGGRLTSSPQPLAPTPGQANSGKATVTGGFCLAGYPSDYIKQTASAYPVIAAPYSYAPLVAIISFEIYVDRRIIRELWHLSQRCVTAQCRRTVAPYFYFVLLVLDLFNGIAAGITSQSPR